MRLLRRQTPAVPNMIFPAADVRDVATMHLATSWRPRWPAADDDPKRRAARVAKADPAFRAGTLIQATRQTRFTLQIVP
jgi:hypothetical protein